MQAKTPFDIYHITGKIYLFLFDELFDLGMHFLRYQEFYESPKFKNISFTLIEFIEWYSKNYGNGAFTYTQDWTGFNIPGDIIWQVHCKHSGDFNKYDAAMKTAYNQISSTMHLLKNNNKYDKFYILGASRKDINVLGHELAHGLYYTNKDYYDAMNLCIDELSKKQTKEIYGYFEKIGYHKSVFKDELQAYFTTGLPGRLKHYKKHSRQFANIFANYTRDVAFDPKNSKPIVFE